MQTSHKRFSVLLGFGLLIILLLTNALVTRRQLAVQEGNQYWVEHTHQVLVELSQAQSLVIDAETGQRGFLYTGDPKYLEPYDLAVSQIDPHIDRFAELTADNPHQQARVPQLRILAHAKLNELAQTIALYQAGKKDDAKALVISDRGLFLMNDIRKLIGEMGQEETSLRSARLTRYQRSAEVTVASIYVATGVAVLGVALLAYFILRAMRVREKHAAELREREEWYRTTLASIGDAVIATDADGLVTFLNPVAERLLGHDLAGAKGKAISEIFSIFNEVTHQPVENPVKIVMARGHIVGLANHTVVRRADGTFIPIEDSAAPIRDAANRIVGVVLVFRDATKERRAERESRLLASIVGSSEDAILSKDLNGNVTSWNRSAQRMFGYTAEEMVGQPVLKLYPPGRENEMREILDRIRRGEPVEHYRTVRRKKDGTLFEVSLSVSPLFDADGTVAGASKIVRDITAEVAAQEVLFKTEKLAAAARLASTVSHEINNPLEAVGNLIYLARSTPGLPAPLAEHLTLAEEELGRVAHIARQTLGFFRETKAMRPISLSAIVERVLGIYASRLKNKHLKVETELGWCPPVQGLDGELTQVVSNLISNAVDAVSVGGTIRLTLSCVEHSDGKALRLSVEDDGPGIAPENMTSIFEPFFTTKKDVGTGLGLWVSREIVDRHGGSIKVVSPKGNGSSGSIFNVFLPISGDGDTARPDGTN
jgi:PAS domain S-box-containing protein